MTCVQQACASIEGFDALCLRLEKKMIINGKCLSTLKNYQRSIAQLALHYRTLPTQLTLEQVEDYLFELRKKTSADAAFKHVLYGMRFLYRAEGLPVMALRLPSIRASQSLPVVLSQTEVRELLKAPLTLRHRTLMAVLYGCGLRLQELRRLQVADIDFERNMIHIRRSKGRKDRYVPIGKRLAEDLKKYFSLEKPVKWLFHGRNYGPCRQQSVRRVIKEAAQRAGICKRVTPHTFRHTYATHLLEQGLDIVTLKELLGHSCINTTMVYLKVIALETKAAFSPLDILFNDLPPLRRIALQATELKPDDKIQLKLLQQQAVNRLRNFRNRGRQTELFPVYQGE